MQRLKNRKSTNPFLDDYQAPAVSSPPRPRSRSPQKQNLPQRNIMASPTNLLDGLTLSDRPSSSRNAPQARPVPSRENMRPSQAAQDRRGPNARGPPPTRFFDLYNKPEENRRPRPRRNSESSIMELHDEERKRIEKERRRRERAERERDGDKNKDGKPRDGRSRRYERRVDMIDKLDLTGIYGVGGAFHHDGPFDACNPHRNKKGRKHTPMQAFPEGSANMMMGGGGPVNKNMDFDRYHGRSADAYNDWNATSQAAENAMMRKPVPTVAPPVESFDSRQKIEIMHGEETAGLGTSTFLEGAPASRSALANRRESDSENPLPAHGLQRKKSLAQKIRGISKSRPNGLAERNMGSPGPVSPSSPIMTQSAGGRAKMNESNPFFSDLGAAAPATSKSKDATVKIDEPTIGRAATMRERAGSEATPVTGHTRGSPSGWRAGRSSDESSDGFGTGPIQKQNTGGGGFLNRVRSIKGKKRAERPAAA